MQFDQTIINKLAQFKTLFVKLEETAKGMVDQ